MKINRYKITDSSSFKIADFPTRHKETLEKEYTKTVLIPENLKKMAQFQDKLYADGKEAILIVIQAMDTAGKDGLIKHVMTTFNPQGVTVSSFKQPSKEEQAHDYLWRASKQLPKRGEIRIFNRSYYEDVVVTRVHDLLQGQNLPKHMKKQDVYKDRYEQITHFEKYLKENGIHVLKFFLHLSKEEQKERLLARIDNPDKNWKFSAGDIQERQYWDEYQKYYEKMIQETSTDYAPWYVIPADQKWFARYLASSIIVDTFQEINPKYPTLQKEDLKNLETWKEALLNEN